MDADFERFRAVFEDKLGHEVERMKNPDISEMRRKIGEVSKNAEGKYGDYNFFLMVVQTHGNVEKAVTDIELSRAPKLTVTTSKEDTVFVDRGTTRHHEVTLENCIKHVETCENVKSARDALTDAKAQAHLDRIAKCEHHSENWVRVSETGQDYQSVTVWACPEGKKTSKLAPKVDNVTVIAPGNTPVTRKKFLVEPERGNLVAKNRLESEVEFITDCYGEEFEAFKELVLPFSA